VIEKLGELQDGGARPPAFAEATADKPGAPPTRPAPVAAGVSPAPRTRAAGTAATTEARGGGKVATVDSEKIWQSVLEKIPAKGLLRTLSELVRPIGTDGRNFVLGHSPIDKAQVEVVTSTNNRRQLETMLNDVSGGDWTVRFVAKNDIPPSGTAETQESSESFKNEPLIQEAIELFNARVSQ
jgi:hypothetical protein